MNGIKVLPGDRVLIQISPYDLGPDEVHYRYRY